jgi:hypothetical protein
MITLEIGVVYRIEHRLRGRLLVQIHGKDGYLYKVRVLSEGGDIAHLARKNILRAERVTMGGDKVLNLRRERIAEALYEAVPDEERIEC